MKYTTIILFFISILFTSCKKTDVTATFNTTDSIKTTNISFANFKSVKGVDNINEVPFELKTKLDTVQFFINPDFNSPSLKVAHTFHNNYYGFEELTDFYKLHFSINNVLDNSVEVFVLKSEFLKNNELTLNGVDLNEVRSLSVNGVYDDKTKTFQNLGSVTEISKQEFDAASKNKINEVFIKNPNVKLQENQWILNQNNRIINLVLFEEESEEGILKREYIGKSNTLGFEIFKESILGVSDEYYLLVNPNEEYDTKFTAAYPQVLPKEMAVSQISNNNDVGVNFIIDKYGPNQKSDESFWYVNFTNFKIANQKNAFWTNHKTFYVEVYPLNAFSPNATEMPKASYIKIQFNDIAY